MTDQRGYSRNGTCDKGAAEYNGVAPIAQTTTKTYYYAGAQLIAMRVLTSTSTLYFLHSDHLGSTSLTTSSAGRWWRGSITTLFPNHLHLPKISTPVVQ